MNQRQSMQRAFEQLSPALIAAVVATAVLSPQRSEAFPSRLVHDSVWAQSAGWWEFQVNGNSRQRVLAVRLQTTSRCADPIVPARASLGANPLCPRTGALYVDLWARIFDRNGEMVGPPVHFDVAQNPGGGINPNAVLAFASRTLPVGRYFLMIHGGEKAEGKLDLSLGWYRPLDFSFENPLQTFATTVSGNIALNVADRPEGFDVVSVLMPDGPVARADGTIIEPGNDANEWLGATATEAWAFDANGAVVARDLGLSGPGPAAWLRNVPASAQLVLVRPFAPPPFNAPWFDATNQEIPTSVGAGRMRVVLNTVGDQDGDRLGNRVERELHLCDGVVMTTSEPGFRGVACWRDDLLLQDVLPRDPRDTDGDGISDGAEVLGADSTWGTLASANGGLVANAVPQAIEGAAQTFPAWGFNPLHKDVLFELDRVGSETVDCMAGGRYRRQNGCPANSFALPLQTTRVNGDPDQMIESPSRSAEQLWKWRTLMGEFPAGRTNNPDGRPGIEVHFDVNFASPAADLRRATRANMLWRAIPGDPRGQYERFGIAGTLIHPWTPSGSECACATGALAPDPRHGGFARWGVGFPNRVGQNSCNQRINAWFLSPATTMLHETGHTFGVNHGGPVPGMNCNNNPFGSSPRATDYGAEDKFGYVSMMNYAYTIAGY